MNDDTSKKNSADDAELTNRQGHPVYNNQSQRTVGDRGPATLENYQFLEKISHFDRERIPERVVHARGFVAHGIFEAYGTIGDEPASKYTRAKLFQEKGKETPVVIRFSTVIGGRDSSEAARDPRGFAVKFKTEDGNWDLVGNNLPVFFIRDAIKFPDVIHALKPDPVTFRQEPNRIFDFMSLTPESMHMLTFLFSPRGIPKNYRTQDGFGVNTYKMVDAEGKAVLVKYHWKTQQGLESLTQEQANAVQATDLGHASKDLFDAIENGDYPQWELCVQVMSDDEHPELDYDPLDDTKTWDEEQFPPPPGRHDDPEPQRRQLFRRGRTGRLRHRACWSTGWTSRTTKCSSGAPFRIRTRSATGWGRTTCNCPSTSLLKRRIPTSATGKWPTTSTLPVRTRT